MPNVLQEVAKIMGVSEETLRVLPKVQYDHNLLNPWGDELLNVFRTLDLAAPKTVLDIPCGQDGVAVYLAKEYGVAVDGYDLFQGFLDNANRYAAEHNVQDLCTFYAEDIRTAIQKRKEYDLVLWSAAPHLWNGYAQTVENLRKCVKRGGAIVIADAYLYSDKLKAQQPDYQTLEETLEAVTAHGDRITRLLDYKGNLWADNYKADREAITKAINRTQSRTERAVLEKYREEIAASERSDIECFGLYILVLQVEKD